MLPPELRYRSDFENGICRRINYKWSIDKDAKVVKQNKLQVFQYNVTPIMSVQVILKKNIFYVAIGWQLIF